MSNSKNKKKSTKKYQKHDTSKLIPIIAVLEVIILIAISTYAWYFFSVDKELSSGIITVNADSGLEIDFQDADKSTYIDIFKYVDKDTFAFEPASSVDGRNIYFPTSGTFGSTDTASMIFRDGTANDVNSKYINIDFELTNTTGKKMDVYLSNKSSFTIDGGMNGKALRLAFYNNDGNSGNVASKLISSAGATAAPTEAGTEEVTEPEADDEDEGTMYYYEDWTVYFNNLSNKTNWGSVRTYVWNYSSGEYATDAWPGSVMTKVSGSLYSFTFKNRYELNAGGEKINYYYDRIAFNNGYNFGSNQTVDITLTGSMNGYLFTPSTQSYDKWVCPDPAPLTLNTIYFLKPTGWNTPACATSTSAFSDGALSNTGYQMTMVTTGVYSYTYPAGDLYIRFVDNSNPTYVHSLQTDTGLVNGKMYYFPDDGIAGYPYTVDYHTSSIYFYNTLGWEQPYAYVNAFADDLGEYTYAIPMVFLSGDLYYCSLSTAFLKDAVDASTATYEIKDAGGTQSISALDVNCRVFFADSASVSTATNSSYANRTVYIDCYSEHVYRAKKNTTIDSTGGQKRYTLEDVDYHSAVDITADSYAVISPGVSAGFQRPANPVNKINYTTGEVESIIPTFASSFDDYIIGSKNPVFSINSGETVNMSMIIWLEGTDTHCTGENYAGRNINLYLEFSTFFAGDRIEGTYTYRFIDETEQHWTSDTITNPKTNVTVSPVMQLYDATLDRGYLMTPTSYTSYAENDKKVKVWECVAPQALVTHSDGKNHDIQFRRVNPYDENEVWNRWEAGDPHTYSADALSNRVVTFTAFADGSPDPTLYSSYITTYNMPAKSCGGLWGTYDVETLTVYDGRKGRASNQTLNFGYTYTYPASKKSVTVEYKASGYRNLAYDANHSYSTSSYFEHFYSIVVPSTIFANASNSYFRFYSGVNGNYAINSNLNTGIEVGTTWWAGTVNGSFFEFNEEGDKSPDNEAHTAASADYHSYWGSDVLYVQGESSLSVSYNSTNNECVMICKYYDSSDVTSDGTKDFKSYLYYDSYYQGSHGYGFVSVVPCDKLYNSYEIQRYRFGAISAITEANVTRKATLANHITPTTDSGRKYNIIKAVDTRDGRIRHLVWDYKVAYFNASNWGSNYDGPNLWYEAYNATDTISAVDTEQTNQYGRKIYQYKVRSDAAVQFVSKNNIWSVKFEGDHPLVDGWMYYPKGSSLTSGGQFDIGGETTGLSERGLNGNGDSASSPYTDIFSDDFDNHFNNDLNSGWPEYVPPQTKG